MPFTLPEGKTVLKQRITCKYGQIYDNGCRFPTEAEKAAKLAAMQKAGNIKVELYRPAAPEVSSRPADITPVLDEHITPPPAIISTPTVVPAAEEQIFGMPKKTAMVVGGVAAVLALVLAVK